MHDRDRAAPITLARDAPVAQAVLHRGLAVALRFQPFGRGGLGRLHVEPVQEIRIDRDTRAHVGRVADCVALAVLAGRQDHGDDG